MASCVEGVRFRPACLGLFLLAVSVASPRQGVAAAGSPAPEAAGQCVAPKTSYKFAADIASTSETSYAQIPGTKVTFTQGGSGRSCVIVKISAVAYAPNGIMFIRARIGGKLADQNEIVFKGSDEIAYGAHEFTFVFPDIKAGKRKVVFEWLSSTASSVFLLDRTVLVEHR